MLPELVEIHNQVKAMHDKVMVMKKAVHAKMQSGELTLEDFADLVYASRDSAKYADELRKDLEKINTVAQHVGCEMWVNDPTQTGEPIRTEYCTASPTVRQAASVPTKKKDPDKYYALMEWLNVPPELVEGDLEIVRLHWPSFCDMLSRRAEAGEPLPAGIDPDKTYPKFTMECRKVKSIDDEVDLAVTETLKTETTEEKKEEKLCQQTNQAPKFLLQNKHNYPLLQQMKLYRRLCKVQSRKVWMN